jgi:hypothetical protein
MNLAAASGELCELCEAFRKRLTGELTKPECEEFIFAHCKSFEALESSSSQGCRLCATFLEAITRCAICIYDNGTPADMQPEEYMKKAASFEIQTKRTSCDRVLSPVAGGLAHLSYESVEWWAYWAGQLFDIFPGIGGMPLVNSRRLRQNPDIGLCKPWLRACEETHKNCGSIGERTLPTRLVEVCSLPDGQATVRLVETSGQRGQYLALSYCWGSGKFLTTTTKNYAAHLERIDIDKAPATIRSASWMTQRLGYRFIWIDCLPIVQDDSKDWEREASQMAHIYQNAELTLAFDDAEGVEEGILHPRAESKDTPIELFLHTRNSERQQSILIVYHISPCPSFSLDTPPLDTGAWTLQESLLSQRILHCKRETVEWTCKSAKYTEGDRYAVSYRSGTDALKLPEPNAPPETTFAQWRAIVNDFGNRRLTYGSDILPAMAGLASESGDVLQANVYVAGLWSGDFVHGLLWQSTESRNEETRMAHKGAELHVPSWSWASVMLRSFEYPLEQPTECSIHDVEILEINPAVCLADTSFAKVAQNTRLRVGGRLRTAIAARSSPSGYEMCLPRYDQQDTDDETFKVRRFFPDGECDSLLGDCGLRPELHCLLMVHWDSSFFGWLALVLMPVGQGRNVFRRVGVARRSTIGSPLQTWFHDVPVQEVWSV